MYSPPSRPVANFLPYAPPHPTRTSACLSTGLPLPPIHSLPPENSTGRILPTLPSRSGRLTGRDHSSLRWLLTPPTNSDDHETGMAYQTAQPPLAPSLEKQLPSIPYSQPDRIMQRPPARLQTLHHPSTVDSVQQQPHLPGPPLHQQYLQTERSHALSATPHYSSSSSHQLNAPLSPTRDGNSKFESLRRVKMARSVRDGILVHASSQLPIFISSKGGSIADFAAQMTCLFWFESIDVLRSAEKFQEWSPAAPLPPLTMFARPENSFKKWIANVLSTTQVTQNVILLAVLFIYRLKMFNPSVWGRPGSEYRLLTVALMLGNKFLDDNTYTNKTWAEVSGIVVQEIHVMEVEFLSNMRYNLVVTRHEWDNWLDKLGNFIQYCTCAGERPVVQPLSPSLPMPSPVNGHHSSPLPLPINHMSPALPIVPRHHHPLGLAMTNSFQPTNLLPVNSTPIRPHPSTLSSPNPVEIGIRPHSSRKRGFVEDATDHPAKRPARHPAGHPPPLVITPSRNPAPAVSQSLRLPVPSLSLITTQSQTSYHPPSGFYPLQDSVSLPPLGQGVRAMSTVYPPLAAGLAQLPCAATTPTRTPGQYSISGNVPLGPPSLNGYGTPTKRQSPGRVSAYGSSPPIESYSSNAATTLCTPVAHTPALQAIHSPSLYLQHRASPYKPVRHVNALLYPPPAASFNNRPLSITPLQMYYQPLGRRHDLRPGIVPGFVMTPGQTALLHHNHHPSLSRVAFVQQP